MLTVRLGEHSIMVETTQGFKAEMGDKLWLGFDSDKVVLFDMESGKSLLN